MIVTDLSKSFHPVPKPSKKGTESDKSPDRTGQKTGQMKKKSSKLAKLERKRYSIITKDLDKCYICHKKKIDLHEIFRGRNRQTSMKNGLVIPVCRKCHDLIPKDKILREELHKIGQKAYEKTHTREEFIATFGKNYL